MRMNFGALDAPITDFRFSAIADNNEVVIFPCVDRGQSVLDTLTS